MKTCSPCAKEYPDEFAFCGTCGRPLELAEEKPKSVLQLLKDSHGVAPKDPPTAAASIENPPPAPITLSAPPSVLKAGALYCRNCGKQVSEVAIACPACGAPPKTQKNFCPHCGKSTNPVQVMCTSCGASLAVAKEKNKVAAGILGICFGGLGAHKFYLGYHGPGAFMLCASVIGGILTMGIAYVLMAIIGLIEGIIYLAKSDPEFVATYIQNKRTWF